VLDFNFHVGIFRKNAMHFINLEIEVLFNAWFEEKITLIFIYANFAKSSGISSSVFVFLGSEMELFRKLMDLIKLN
jgi:hypothetical protein